MMGSMNKERIVTAEELNRIANQWLDRAVPWVPFWSGFCIWRAHVYGAQLRELALKGAEEALNGARRENK
jgi:hypothetical protein